MSTHSLPPPFSPTRKSSVKPQEPRDPQRVADRVNRMKLSHLSAKELQGDLEYLHGATGYEKEIALLEEALRNK